MEVANTSRRQDIETQARLYAKARIPEYWVVVVPDRAVEVHRVPRPRQGLYAQRFKAGEADNLAPTAISAVEAPQVGLMRLGVPRRHRAQRLPRVAEQRRPRVSDDGLRDLGLHREHVL